LYTRLGYFTQYEQEAWRSIPAGERKKIDDWYIDEFTRRLKEHIDREKEHFFRDSVLPIRRAVEKIEEIGETLGKPFYVVPCNCRTTTGGCTFSIDTCIANNYEVNGQWDRGYGRRVTIDEVKDLLYACDREGLMHIVAPNGHICNCETCCCYEFRGALKLGTKGIYPRVEFVARVDEEKCVQCGKCAARCHFKAFEREGPKKIRFRPELCWGCGICECTCPKDAITLVPLDRR
jgi:Pyruvate/2-oxoacid:ferredoxin oxidoreductase delta subunit